MCDMYERLLIMVLSKSVMSVWWCLLFFSRIFICVIYVWCKSYEWIV